MSEEINISIKKENIWKYSTFILAAILIVGAFVFFFNNSSSNGTGTGNTVGNQGGAVVKVSAGDSPVLGSKNAAVTIVEFSDYQCPFCRKFYTETFGQIKKDYIDTGKVKLVFRNFPLSFHPAAEPAAEAALCVREKGGDEAYYKMHDKIFEEGNILDSGSATGAVTKTAQFTSSDLKAWAKEIGYDISSCLDSGKYKDEVAKDQADGASYGVQGTPAFFVNGKLLSGAQPYSAFKAAIDAELAK